jgi:hypothetical protein
VVRAICAKIASVATAATTLARPRDERPRGEVAQNHFEREEHAADGRVEDRADPAATPQPTSNGLRCREIAKALPTPN